jgi:hypothetical protein
MASSSVLAISLADIRALRTIFLPSRPISGFPLCKDASRVASIYEEGSIGFGGLSGLTPSWRTDRRSANQHLSFFVFNNKQVDAEWRVRIPWLRFGDNPANPPNPINPSSQMLDGRARKIAY